MLRTTGLGQYCSHLREDRSNDRTGIHKLKLYFHQRYSAYVLHGGVCRWSWYRDRRRVYPGSAGAAA